jgi:hypothetical protein
MKSVAVFCSFSSSVPRASFRRKKERKKRKEKECAREKKHTENGEECAKSVKREMMKRKGTHESTLSKERKEKKKGKTVFSSLRST